MAVTGQADGTIIIDTSIDTSGIEIGSEKLQSAMLRVGKRISRIGKNMKNYLKETGSAFSEQSKLCAQQERALGKETVKSGELKTTIPETDEYRKLGEEIKKLESQIDLAKKKQELFLEAGGSTGSSMYVSTAKDIDVMNQKLDAAYEKKKRLEMSAGVSQQPVDTSAQDSALLSSAGRMSEQAEGLKMSFTSLRDSAVSYIKQLNLMTKMKNIAIGTFKRFGSMVNKVGSAILGLNKNTKKSNGTFGLSLKTILKYTLGIRILYVLFNKARGAIVEGFQNLAQYSGDTNKDISMLVSSLTQLKNSLATAFAPILSVVAPILSKFINMISQAVTYVGMFFAALTGKGIFTKAVAVQQNYAAGLEKTGSAAKDAAKELKGYLSPIDEINKMEKQDTSDTSGGGSGAGGVSPAQMFKTIDIESPIKDIAKRLRELIQSEDWQGLGAYIADGINTGFAKLYYILNWDTYGSQISHFVYALTATLNSLMYNINWELIGATFGTGINTIVNTLNLLITSIDWNFLGYALATGLMSMIVEINWRALGNLIGNKFMIGWRVFSGFVKKLDYKTIGKSIASGINGVLETLDIGLIFGALSTFAIGILQTLTEAIKGTDWISVGQQICNALMAIDWIGLGSSLFDAGLTLISGLLEAFGELPLPVQIAAEAIGGFFAAFIGYSIVKSIISLIIGSGGFVSALGAIVSALGGPVTLAIAGAITMIGLLIANWNDAKIVMQKFDDWLQKVFATDWTEYFGIFGNGINDFFRVVSEVWDGVKTVFNGFLTFLKGIFSRNWDMALSGLVQIFEGLFNSLVGIAKAPINDIIGLINGMVSSVAAGVNAVIDLINSLDFTVPDWVPIWGGKSFSPNIHKFTPPKIPYLATGAVIPPNAPFMAMLGDQKNGNNLEMPENLLRRIVREETGNGRNSGGTYRFVGQINRRVLFDEFIEEAKMRQSANGLNPFYLR